MYENAIITDEIAFRLPFEFPENKFLFKLLVYSLDGDYFYNTIFYYNKSKDRFHFLSAKYFKDCQGQMSIKD